MAMLLLDSGLEKRIRDERRAWGADHHDEVWEGIYRVTPLPNNEHQQIVGQFVTILQSTIGWQGLGEVWPGVNVSDRTDDWTKNYRCPDVAVYLKGTAAQNCGSYWLGGPDFLIEVVSPGDDSRAKLPFYAKVGTREVLIVERDPWLLELFRLEGERLVSAGVSDFARASLLASQVVPFTFRLVSGSPRPKVEIHLVETGQTWRI